MDITKDFIIILLCGGLFALFVYNYFSYLACSRQEKKNAEKFKITLNEKIQAQKIAFKEAYDDLDQFTTMISHDLKGPLSFIVKSHEFISEKVEATEDLEIIDYFDAVVSSSEQMIKVIDDLLAYSKSSSTKPALVPIDTSLLISTVEDSVFLKNRRDKVKVSYLGLPVIISDSSLLFMVFKNLIENAIKYNKKEYKRITITYSQSIGYHQFSVQDNGIGIPPSERSKVFLKYKRIKAVEGFQGMGIGLASCRSAINRLGGEIYVDPVYSLGTIIHFTLPYMTKTTKELEAEAEAAN